MAAALNLGEFEQLILLAILGGRAKRYVKVTASGMEALTRVLQAYERLLDGLDLSRGVR